MLPILLMTCLVGLPSPDTLQLLHFADPPRFFITGVDAEGPAADLYQALRSTAQPHECFGEDVELAGGLVSAAVAPPEGRSWFKVTLTPLDKITSLSLNVFGSGKWLVAFRGPAAAQLLGALAGGAEVQGQVSSPGGYATCYVKNTAESSYPTCAISNRR